VIIYSGYSFDRLLKKREWAELLEETDLLIDGPYIRELDDGKSLRGSSNQSVIALTDRYKPYLDMYGSENRETQIFDHGYYRSFVGVPAGDY
ncbi:MAG: 4Fe-4S cluster-binding domain-containing protein, partial [Lachnospiraceae bacterium]|nr:4Fe-4S cluster-binding domain-containing protein [Lachnospiraceae bacterium]